jgi:choline dehydrogenase-like flavoprotein
MMNMSWNVSCSREIILAAGAVMSPVLLQVSGIGPAFIISDIGVPLQVHLPGVGQNLQDHGMVGAFYNCEALLPQDKPELPQRHAYIDDRTDSSPDLFTANNITGKTLIAVEDQYMTNRTGM